LDGLQIIKFRPLVNRALTNVKQATWQERMGHINAKFLKATAEKKAAHGLENNGHGKLQVR